VSLFKEMINGVQMMKYFEEMTSGIRNWAWKYFSELNIFKSNVPNWGLETGKNCWIMKIPFSRHDSIDPSCIYAFLHILQVLNVSICYHRY